jgi:hypothetical protein
MSAAQATQPTKSEATPARAPSLDSESDKRKASEQATREKTKRIFEAFKSTEVGLLPFPASLLTAHAFSTVDKMADKSVEEAKEWALDFRRSHPVVWGTLATQNMMGFMKQLRLHQLIDCDNDAEFVMLNEEYSQLGSIIAREK